MCCFHLLDNVVGGSERQQIGFTSSGAVDCDFPVCLPEWPQHPAISGPC